MEYVKVVKQDKDGAHIKVEFEVSSEGIEPVYQKVLEGLKKQARIAGFRPGKAPVKLVEQKYGERADALVLEEFIPEIIHNYNVENEMRSLDTPQISLVGYERNQKLHFQAEYDIYPEVIMPTFAKISVKEDFIKVEEEDIAKELEILRNKNAELKKREGKAQQGDELSLMVTVTDPSENDKVLEENKMMKTVLGKNTKLPDLDRNLDGVAENEERSFTVEYPGDFEHQELRNRKLFFRCQIKEVNEVVLPPIDDELAKDEGYESLEILRSMIQKNMEDYGNGILRRDAKEKVVVKAAEQTKVDLPASLVQTEIKSILRNMSYQVGRQYETLEALEQELKDKDGKKISAEIRKQADNNTRRILLLMENAKKQDLQVTEEELDQRIQWLAYQYRMSAEDLRAQFEENGRIQSVANDVLLDKSMDFIYEAAEKKPGKSVRLSELTKNREEE